MPTQRTIPRTCEQCDSSFLANEREVQRGGGRFCSRTCRSRFFKPRALADRQCEQCGMLFRPKESGQRFCSHPCYAKSVAGSGEHRPRVKNGYIVVYAPNHPDAGKGGYPGYVREHRVVAGETRGRPLSPEEHVHHQNEIKGDNLSDNLLVVSNSEHGKIHGQRYVPERIPDAVLIAGLQEAARRLGKTPRRRDMKAFSDLPSDTPYHNHYGCWNNALRAAGLSPNLVKDGSRWATHYDVCVDCKTADRPHYAGGRCQKCYARQRGKG